MSVEKYTHSHDYVMRDSKIGSNEKKTALVVILTFVTMIAEITYGHITGSMALLADGWHMASHVGALGISLVAYRLARSEKLNQRFSFGAGKFIPLGGYTSALMLGLVAIFMGYESLHRVLNPVDINFSTAIGVSVLGLIVNLVSAILLWDSHDHHHGHDHHHHHDDCAHGHGYDHDDEHVHDHNHKSALIHVIADAFTSVLAIVALITGKYLGWNWADPAMGIVGSVVILKWAYGLCRATLWELLDGNSKLIKKEDVLNLFEDDVHVEVTDLHIWRIAPNAHACELMVYSKVAQGSEFYRSKILAKFDIEHLIIEERT
ncbi:CDF family Co(II)/Ni(II) efflux transporter DmeF [Bacteriovorax sp. Seq25_V]|uniref:CDF family Co(II)/Ni(II) efflux transporter DmeF n=1 Tax=Bacteriovorax sp. Seq25_V TaxID=1201288 RepID=UPI00038A0594|nr:CDF family Co(II)/Ni(II) efflux transporter DmeF [Bacteriovorax sp. Seq25_V]EQC46658.1 cation diffusion facilitator family transporter [Bacteriovorax sp. Seq25_V]